MHFFLHRWAVFCSTHLPPFVEETAPFFQRDCIVLHSHHQCLSRLFLKRLWRIGQRIYRRENENDKFLSFLVSCNQTNADENRDRPRFGGRQWNACTAGGCPVACRAHPTRRHRVRGGPLLSPADAVLSETQTRMWGNLLVLFFAALFVTTPSWNPSDHW